MAASEKPWARRSPSVRAPRRRGPAAHRERRGQHRREPASPAAPRSAGREPRVGRAPARRAEARVVGPVHEDGAAADRPQVAPRQRRSPSAAPGCAGSAEEHLEAAVHRAAAVPDRARAPAGRLLGLEHPHRAPGHARPCAHARPASPPPTTMQSSSSRRPGFAHRRDRTDRARTATGLAATGSSVGWISRAELGGQRR